MGDKPECVTDRKGLGDLLSSSGGTGKSVSRSKRCLVTTVSTYRGRLQNKVLTAKQRLLKMQTFDRTLAMFVRERVPATAQQTAEIANQYLQVHGGTLTGARNVMRKSVNKYQNVLFRGQCYTCGWEGHKAEDCMVKPQQPTRSDPEWKNYCIATEVSERILTEETEEVDAPETEVLDVTDVTDVTSYEVSQAVVTRAQTVKAARPTKPLTITIPTRTNSTFYADYFRSYNPVAAGSRTPAATGTSVLKRNKEPAVGRCPNQYN